MTSSPHISEQPGPIGSADQSDAPVIRVQNVYKVFGKRPERVVEKIKAGADRKDIESEGVAAVIDASFEVNPGEIFVVMGLSGSGKSTLIRTLNALQPATSGTVEVMGQDLAELSKNHLRDLRARHLSMVFQHFALLPHWTVLDNAAYGLEIQGYGRKERQEMAAQVLASVGLAGWEKRYPSELSGGMQQRVGLARALASQTDVMLMDEAFSALDPLIRREMQEEMISLQRELHRTIVFITHDLNEAMYMGDRIAVMKEGRIVQIGTPEEILSVPANDYVASFTADVDRSRVLTAQSVMVPPTELSEAEITSFGRTHRSVKPGATLQEIVPVAVEADGPVAVEGEDHGKRVKVGYVRVSRLLEAMSPQRSETLSERLEPAESTDPADTPTDASVGRHAEQTDPSPAGDTDRHKTAGGDAL
ncbi:quaternary amine ABC transporter ATP-binding protein [Auritidibacter ignavus]|uniref:quaternary amine ABC transporter ATP-binding protein n=1 Tax=Auritidibacter ignavus TaxID=678932 RepID=UPI00109C88C5|nr:glycine betaine/L-proline ABC transporter ATP-binding protein [Auritidibacter ignavus]